MGVSGFHMRARWHVAFGLTLVCLVLGGVVNVWAEDTKGEWKTYRNFTYHFSIGYPAKLLELFEGDTKSFFPPPAGKNHGLLETSLLKVCFPPLNRSEFYCEIELYVVPAHMVPYSKGMKDFLGFQICPPEKTKALVRPRFDSLKGTEIDTCGEEGLHRNVFVEKDGLVYLLVTEPSIGWMAENPNLFSNMLNSFRWLDTSSTK
jgi:hypothetical protein